MNEEDIKNRIRLIDQRIEESLKQDKIYLARGYANEKRKWNEVLKDLEYNERITQENRQLKGMLLKARRFVKSFEYYIPEDDKPELLEILGDKE